MSGLFEHLKGAAKSKWDAYADHDYIRRLAANRSPEAYQSVAANARRELDRLADGPLPPSRLRRLEAIFATACDLEAAFWQMALDNAKESG